MKAFFSLFKKIFSLKNLIHYDNILILGSFFLIFGLLFSSISLNILDPVSDAFSDVQLTDINFSYLGKNDDLRGVDKNGEPILDTNIVVVNFGDLKRPGIANLLLTINNYSPSVIGVDAIFDTPKDSLSDFTLANALSKIDNVVIVAKGLNPDIEGKKYTSFENPLPIFSQNADVAIANLVMDNSSGTDLEKFKVCREFISGHNISDSFDLAFAPKLCTYYDNEKADKLRQRNTFEETINYSGNQFVEFSQNNIFPRFKSVDYREVFQQDFVSPEALKSLFKDKIVLVGYMGDDIHALNDDDDKFFTPLNKKYIGKAELDMYGVIIHANIISQILNDRYIDKMPSSIAHIIGLILFYLTIASFRPVYNDHKIWYDGGTKVASFAYAVIILFISFWSFDTLNYQISISGIYIGAILLAGDYMEIYYGLFVNIFHKIAKKE